jgi:exosortase/archaeosortase family protein
MYAGEGKVKAMWFPLFYLLFAFPLPNLIEQSFSPWLRLASARAAYAVIHLVGWPGELQGTMVVGPQFSFDVTPACSGIRAVHTFLVGGILAARLMHSRPRWFWIQTLLILPAILLANSLRIIAIAAIGHQWGAAAATGLAHGSAGVVFFAVVFLGFLVAGHQWFPRDALPSEPAISKKSVSSIAAPAAGALAWHGIAFGLAVAMVSGIQFHRFQTIPERPAIPFLISDWIGNQDPMSVQEADYYGSRYLEKRRYTRGNEVIDMAIVTSAFSRGNLHDPVECYYLMGWNVRHREVVTLEGGPRSACRLSLEFTGAGEKAGQRLACLFWFQSKTGLVLAEQRQLILRSFRQRLLLEPEELWTLYSLATPCDPKREDLSWKRLESLAAGLQPGQPASRTP